LPRHYRIEIDVHVEDGAETAIMGLARTHYQAGRQAWTEENGSRIPVPVDEYIEDIESALLELIEAGFQAAVPHAEPDAFRCVLISDGPSESARPEKAAGKWCGLAPSPRHQREK
jgi:hypothetical protein